MKLLKDGGSGEERLHPGVSFVVHVISVPHVCFHVKIFFSSPFQSWILSGFCIKVTRDVAFLFFILTMKISLNPFVWILKQLHDMLYV